MMDRALKERIIGAAVLVVFVVLVVPIFLDGPPEEGETVTERVLLPGQEEQETKTVVLDRERSVPIPPASSSTAQQPEPADEEPAREPETEPKPLVQQAVEQPEEKAPEPVAEEPPKPAPTQVAASTTGMWAVQLGSFSNKDNAERLADQLRKQGYAAFVSQVATGNGTMHRVRIGPQKDREKAEEMVARLARVGHTGRAVPHP